MADVVFIFVREDADRAEALASILDQAGFSIGDLASTDVGAAVILLSHEALRSPRFVKVAERFINADRAVVANVYGDEVIDLGDTPVFDLSDWDGVGDDPIIDPLFFAVDQMVVGEKVERAPPPAKWERVVAELPRPKTPREAAWVAELPTALRAARTMDEAAQAPDIIDVEFGSPPPRRRRIAMAPPL